MNVLESRAAPSKTIDHESKIGGVIFLVRKIQGNILQVGAVEDLQG